MSALDAKFAGSIPAIYEEYLGPLLFEPYAEDLAERIEEIVPRTVLEIAAGTGIVTRALDRTLPPDARVVATDLNQAMLDVAARRTGDSSVTWKQADAQRLPFGAGDFDAVICQFGFMFVPDRVKAYREARRVLTPNGRLLFNVWDSLAANEVTRVVAEAVAALFPDDPPRFIERTPFGYHDVDLIRTEVVRAGFEAIGIDPVEKTTLVPSPQHAAIGLCQGTPLRSEIEARAPERLEEITGVAAQALEARFGAGPFENRMRALVVAADVT